MNLEHHPTPSPNAISPNPLSRRPLPATSFCKTVRSAPDVTHREPNQRRMAILFLISHIRKTGKCPRRAWKAHWQNPDVIHRELKVRRRPIFILMWHIRKTGTRETGARSAPEGPGGYLGEFLTLHVRSETGVRGRFLSQRYTSGIAGRSQTG